jgi:hypothetical protein
MKVQWFPTMHDAFEYASILERLPLVIESIASYGKGDNFNSSKLSWI